MPVSELKLIKRCVEFCDVKDIRHIPRNTRGIYVLYQRYNKSGDGYDVVCIGMARGAKSGAHRRLNAHRRFKRKKDKWTHFSLFEVRDNVTEDEVAELEGLFRHVYRKDTKANALNVQKGFKKLKRVGKEKLEEWQRASTTRKKAFFALAKRFRTASDHKKVKRLGDQMGRFVFGK